MSLCVYIRYTKPLTTLICEHNVNPTIEVLTVCINKGYEGGKIIFFPVVRMHKERGFEKCYTYH